MFKFISSKDTIQKLPVNSFKFLPNNKNENTIQRAAVAQPPQAALTDLRNLFNALFQFAHPQILGQQNGGWEGVVQALVPMIVTGGLPALTNIASIDREQTYNGNLCDWGVNDGVNNTTYAIELKCYYATYGIQAFDGHLVTDSGRVDGYRQFAQMHSCAFAFIPLGIAGANGAIQSAINNGFAFFQNIGGQGAAGISIYMY